MSDTSGFAISVKLSSTNTITLDVLPSHTIGNVKDKIYEKEHIVPSAQRLIFAGVEPSDTSQLTICGIKNGSILHLIHRTTGLVFPIYIKSVNGKTYTIHVNANDTIYNLKQKINEQEDKKLLPDQQRLFWKGTELINDMSLNKYEIVEANTLQLVSKTLSSESGTLTVQIKAMGGKVLNFTVAPIDTVFQLKQKFYEKEGIGPELQKVVIKGIQRNDDNTMGSLGITDGSTIFIIYR